MATGNYTQTLLSEMEGGLIVVCSMEPYQGWTVAYAPRSKQDAQPWRLNHKDGTEWKGGLRFSGRFCHSIENQAK